MGLELTVLFEAGPGLYRAGMFVETEKNQQNESGYNNRTQALA